MKTCEHLIWSVCFLVFISLDIEVLCLKSNKNLSTTERTKMQSFSYSGSTNVSLTAIDISSTRLFKVIASKMVSNFSKPAQNDIKPDGMTLAEVYRHRVLVSGYLIVSVVAAGLVFLLVTHYLGKRQLKRSNKNPNSPYRTFTRWELQQI